MGRISRRLELVVYLIFIIPILGIILYVNTVKLLKNIKAGKNTELQTGLGAALTGVVLFLLLILIIEINSYG